MIAKAEPDRTDALLEAAKRWLRERAPEVDGFVDEWVMIGDDGSTVVVCTRFASREHYQKLATDPAQDRFWRDQVAVHINGEARWIDGTWAYASEPMTT